VGVPKVSEAHKEQRRAQILEAAQRAFARHGYEGTTVAVLEEATGLSRGAIFNYFPNKQAIFLELAVESNLRLTEIWLEHGFRALLEEIAHEDPDWLGVQLEAARRVHTDPAFQELVAKAEAELHEHKQERLDRFAAQGVRDDVPLETAAVFLSLVANGLALRRTLGDPMPDLDVLAELVERGVAPRRSRKKATEWKTPSPRTRPTPRSRRPSSAG
jgi:TetR/AcrR family transcriptional regulator, transcriptional repressor of aconitase